MRIEAIDNGWLVYAGQDNYLGNPNSPTVFCGTKEEVLAFIQTNLKSKEELTATWKQEQEERRKQYQSSGAIGGGIC